MKKIFVLIVSVLLALGTFPVVRSPGVASAAVSDMESKVAALPKDSSKIYIINSLNDTVETVDLSSYSYVYPSPNTNVTEYPLEEAKWYMLHVMGDTKFLYDKRLTFGLSAKKPPEAVGAWGYLGIMERQLSWGDYTWDINHSQTVLYPEDYLVSRQRRANNRVYGYIPDVPPGKSYVAVSNMLVSRDYTYSDNSGGVGTAVTRPYTSVPDDWYTFFYRYSANAPVPYVYFDCSVAQYTVTFKYLTAAGTWGSSVHTVDGGTTAEAIGFTCPTVEHASFVGWNAPLTTLISSDLVYTANYTFDRYGVSLCDRYGSVTDVVSVSYFDHLADKLSLPMSYFVTKDNKRYAYSGVGWTTEPGGTTPINLTTYRVSTNVTFYPVYKLTKTENITADGKVTDSFFTRWWNAEFLGMPLGRISMILVAILLLPILGPLVVSLFRWLYRLIVSLINRIRGHVETVSAKRRKRK